MSVEDAARREADEELGIAIEVERLVGIYSRADDRVRRSARGRLPALPDYTPDPQVVPYLLYEDAGGAMDWLIRVFGFTERRRDEQHDGTVRHSELLLDDGGVTCSAAQDRASRSQQSLASDPDPVRHDRRSRRSSSACEGRGCTRARDLDPG